jgi:DNA-binding LacI/PurR family transcriptional regulator
MKKQNKEERKKIEETLKEYGYKRDIFGWRKKGRPFIYIGFIMISTEKEIRKMLEEVEDYIFYKEKDIEEDAKN